MTSSANYYPDFFIIFLPEQHSQRMIIPNAFHEFTRLKENLPEDVILRDHRSGRVWDVKARFIVDKLCLEFDDGWKQFRKENSLNKADFLVFSYDGNKEFKFKIFDMSSGCERKKVKEEEEHGEDADYMMWLEGKIKEEICEYLEITEEKEHEDEDTEMEDEEDDDSEDDSYGYDDDDDDVAEDDSDDEEDTECEDELRSQPHRRATKASDFCKRSTVRTLPINAEDPELEDYAVDAEMLVNPHNPNFVVKKSKTRRNELYIPRTIITDFSLSFPENVTLLCCQCKNIPRNVVQAYHLNLNLQQQTLFCSRGDVAKNNRNVVIVRGWTRFSRKNKIKENDVCICEVVLGEDQNIKMLLVHVRCA